MARRPQRNGNTGKLDQQAITRKSLQSRPDRDPERDEAAFDIHHAIKREPPRIQRVEQESTDQWPGPNPGAEQDQGGERNARRRPYIGCVSGGNGKLKPKPP